MLKSGLLLLIVTAAAVCASCSNQVSDRDGNTYDMISIGDQVWVTGNLNVTHFRNGDEIQEAKTPEEWILLGNERKPAWRLKNGTEDNGKKYGRLYNWYAVTDPRGLAPRGWHIPSDEEWKKMTDFLGGEIMASFSLRSVGLGTEGDKQPVAAFSGLPAGCCSEAGMIFGFGSNAYWWTSTEHDPAGAWVRMLDYVRCSMNSMAFNKQRGLSVRCIRNIK